MVEDRITDGRRIAQLLASELDAREGDLAGLSVTDANPEVDPTPDGAHAYDVRRDGERLARVFVHPDRVTIRVEAADESVHTRALSAARAVDLPVRRTDGDPPRAVLVVEDGVAVKRASDAFAGIVGDDSGGGGS